MLQSFGWSLHPKTVYVELAVECIGAADDTITVYVDDVQAFLPHSSGVIWSVDGMPPQIKATEISAGVFSTVWAQINMKALKVLIGSRWSNESETALQAIDSTYPAKYWVGSSSNPYELRADLYHPVRRNWMSRYTAFPVALLSTVQCRNTCTLMRAPIRMSC